MLNNILQWLVSAEDTRQQAKIKHLMKDIIKGCAYQRYFISSDVGLPRISMKNKRYLISMGFEQYLDAITQL